MIHLWYPKFFESMKSMMSSLFWVNSECDKVTVIHNFVIACSKLLFFKKKDWLSYGRIY